MADRNSFVTTNTNNSRVIYYNEYPIGTLKPIETLKMSVEKTNGRLKEVEKYLINNEAVVIMFKDGTKTVASVDPEDKFDKELGFCLAMYKYVAKRNKVSKGSYKRELACIKEDKLKDYLVENFDRFTFKNLEKSRKFLKNLKITGKKWAKVN